VIVKTAAVCDWRPAEAAAQKIKKGDGSAPSLVLEPNPDILRELGEHRPPGQILVGFAAETTDVEANARAKLAAKKLDVIVANDVTAPNAGFHVDTNAVRIFTAEGKEVGVPLMTKDRVADRVLGVVVKLRHGTQRQTWAPAADRVKFWEEE